MEQISSKNLNELKEKYPIGTKLNYKQRKVFFNLPYYNENDLQKYKKQYLTVEILDENYCKVSEIEEKYNKVDGYLFDGEDWIVVEDTWDGWYPIEVDNEEQTNV